MAYTYGSWTLIIWLTLGLVAAEFQDAARRDIDRAIKNVKRFNKVGDFKLPEEAGDG